MATQEAVVSITFEAGADLSAATGQWHFVELAADGQVDVVSSAGGDAIGVLLNDPDAAGRAAEVQVGGVAKVEVGTGGVTAGDKVQSDAVGEAILAATGGHVLGRALETGVAGQRVSVLLNSHHILA